MFLITISSNHDNFCLKCSNNDDFSFFLRQPCRAFFLLLRREQNATYIFLSFLTQERLKTFARAQLNFLCLVYCLKQAPALQQLT